MSKKHSFWSLCQEYNKIEIPIIQRDYAQGRISVENIRNEFVEYLINNLINKKSIELDFVYGSVLQDDKHKSTVFIPLDGQQRLTTLFLLHWYIAIKEDRIHDAKHILGKFTYETRPSSHDFCLCLIEKSFHKDIKIISQYIKDAEWYNDEWDSDNSVTGMIRMLDTFSSNKKLNNNIGSLYNYLTCKDEQPISFYFIPLDKFGLTENLYVRMNARGKILTDFENFKSEFYKIIQNFKTIDDIKDKMEYAWVEALWNYKESKVYVTDIPFMQYLSFISEMLYYKGAQFRADKYETDFLDFKVLNKIYSNETNLKFIVFAFDSIKMIEEFSSKNLLWSENSTLKDILKDIISGKRDTNQCVILFSVLCFLFHNESENNLSDFIRVVRNLIHNTKDNSRREWPKLFKSISNLFSDKNVYDLLVDGVDLDGFYVPQRNEEIFKAKLIKANHNNKEILFTAEDNFCFEGNITSLIASTFVHTEENILTFKFEDIYLDSFNSNLFLNIYCAYTKISSDFFKPVWGNLINSSLYTQYTWGRLNFDNNYSKNPGVIHLAKKFAESGEELDLYLINKEREFINEILISNPDLSTVRNVKEQLYIYFIFTKRIMKKGNQTFFKNGYNFGWLSKEIGFNSFFKCGIENDDWFQNSNPIFQTYTYQFRYNMGIKKENALDVEVVGSGRKNNPFELLKEWANS